MKNDLKRAIRDKFNSLRYCCFDSKVVGIGETDSSVYHFEVEDSIIGLSLSLTQLSSLQQHGFDDSNLFYFVVPKGIYKGVKLPKDVGIMEVTSGGKVKIRTEANFREFTCGVSTRIFRKLATSYATGEDTWFRRGDTDRILGTMTRSEAEKFIYSTVDKLNVEYVRAFDRKHIEKASQDRLNELLTNSEEYSKIVEGLNSIGVDFHLGGGSKIGLHNMSMELKEYVRVVNFIKDHEENILIIASIFGKAEDKNEED